MNVLTSDLLSGIDFVAHGFFDRTDGESSETYESLNVGIARGDDEEKVINNRKKIAEYFEISVENLVILNQKHSDTVHIINADNKAAYLFGGVAEALKNEGDALITKEPGVLIGVNTADCAPILLCDKGAGYVAAIHAGWRGSNGQIIENTIAEMKSLGCKTIVASIGPCLQRIHFEIKDDIDFQIDRQYVSYDEGRTLFDMQLQILEKLMKNGVKTVSKMNVDTYSNTNYFSKRRIGEKTGVQFSGIMIKEKK
ncbi:MAG: laccase domain-containing protein [Alphaproteobacteria bacterium]|nr:laccase domain-containing protein [Alphaproteobacteria bacterium]